MTRDTAMWMRESVGAWEGVRLLGWAPWLARAPRGAGQLVVLVPGFQSNEAVMDPLARFLRYLGYDARPWGRGWNRGKVEQDVRGMMPVLEAWTAEHGRPAAMVGWSLGGVISRELARELPQCVQTVITYGTPVVGGPTWTSAAGLYGEAVCARAAARSRQREIDRPLQQPLTIIYTRSDHIVSWPACIDRISPNATHVEVRSTHVGLGLDPDVWWTVARALQHHMPVEAS